MAELDIEIRKLPPGVIYDLSKILECGEGWKQLMASIQEEESNKPKYTVEHMKLVECAAGKQRRTCSEILLEEWGCSGRKRPTLSTLKALLVQLQLFRAAEYVALKLLQQEPPERPAEGPAARVDIPTSEELGKVENNETGAGEKIANIKMEEEPTAPPLPSETLLSIQLEETTPLTTEPIPDIDGVTMYNYSELQRGTDNFSLKTKLGGGAFGQVFLCELAGGEKVAVKRLVEGAALADGGFRAELQAVASVSHPNLLSLVGASSDGPSLCLVYHYMPGGSLETRLQPKEGEVWLNWEQRCNIASGCARGLLHLHQCGPRPLVHRDVKSANILLDHDLTPKVGDFGLVRGGSAGTITVAMTTTVVGTSAYMAPEAFRGDVSVKMDVFSFGVVLLELATGLPPYDENRDGCDLASHVEEVGDIETLIDPKGGDRKKEQVAQGLYSLAEKCLLEKKQRPFMVQVLNELEHISAS